MILGLIASTFFSLSVSAQKTSITTAELPANAQTFLKKHFPNETPSSIIKEKEVFSTEYKANEKAAFRSGLRYSIQNKFDNQYAASLGFRYLFPQDFELRLGAGRSYRTPNFDELYSELIFSGHFFVGNENLIPETSTSFDFGLKKKFSFESLQWQSQLAVNFLDVKDRIEMALHQTKGVVYAELNMETKVVEQNIRSGQQIYVKGADLIIKGTVGAGAEVIADGNIHIYGSLRGKAIAGAGGDSSKKIYCYNMQAELISIAGNYWLSESLQGEFWGKSACISLQDGQLVLAELF